MPVMTAYSDASLSEPLFSLTTELSPQSLPFFPWYGAAQQGRWVLYGLSAWFVAQAVLVQLHREMRAASDMLSL